MGGNEPGISRYLNNDGTYPGFRIIYLQRLANPTQAFGAGNPYRTIDAMPVDLTTFNGATTATMAKDPFNQPQAAFPVHFESRQRGDFNAPAGEKQPLEAGAVRQDGLADAGVNGQFTPVRNPPLCTLGYLNTGFTAGAGALVAAASPGPPG